MKNEKFCFSKGTGLIALVGIVLVAAALLMGGLSSTSTSTSTRATAQDTCYSPYSLTTKKNVGGSTNNGQLQYDKQNVAVGSCEKFEYQGQRLNTGRTCVSNGTKPASFSPFLKDCPISCVYGNKVLDGESASVPTYVANTVYKNTTMYLDDTGIDKKWCIAERKHSQDGIGGRLTGYICDFSTPVTQNGGVFAKMTKDTGTCTASNLSGTRTQNVVTNASVCKNPISDTTLTIGSPYGINHSVGDTVYFIDIMFADANNSSKTGWYDLHKGVLLKNVIATDNLAVMDLTVSEALLSGVDYDSVCYLAAANTWSEIRYSASMEIYAYGSYDMSDEYVACMGYRNNPQACEYGMLNGKKQYVAFGESPIIDKDGKKDESLACGCRRAFANRYGKSAKLLKYPVVDNVNLIDTTPNTR